MKLQAFDSCCFRGKHHFEGDGTQNYLVFQPMYRYFKKIGDDEHGNLEDCPMKLLSLLIHLVIALLQHQVILVTK